MVPEICIICTADGLLSCLGRAMYEAASSLVDFFLRSCFGNQEHSSSQRWQRLSI